MGDPADRDRLTETPPDCDRPIQSVVAGFLALTFRPNQHFGARLEPQVLVPFDEHRSGSGSGSDNRADGRALSASGYSAEDCAGDRADCRPLGRIRSAASGLDVAL